MALLAIAGATGPRYGDTLLSKARPVARGAAVRIDAIGKSGLPITVGPAGTRGSRAVLTDAMGQPIGTVTVAAGPARASLVASWLARRIYVAENLSEPDPLVPGARSWRKAQALVDRALARHPDLVTLAMHANLPGGGNGIVASSFGRIGKAADEDDLHVIREGTVLREATNNGRRLAVELPLLDRDGHVVGALSTSFSTPHGNNPELTYARAVAVRNSIAREIPSLSAMAEY